MPIKTLLGVLSHFLFFKKKVVFRAKIREVNYIPLLIKHDFNWNMTVTMGLL